MKQPNRTIQILVELILIVVGVSIALSADQWAQGRAEQERLEGYLAQLDVALVADSIHLESRIRVIDSRLGGANALESHAGRPVTEAMGCASIVLSESASERIDCDESQPAPLATHLLLASFAVGSPLVFALDTGPFDDLRASGLAPLLPANLRTAITGYYLAAADGEEYWTQVESGLDELVLGVLPSGWVRQLGSTFEFSTEPSASERVSIANGLLMDDEFVRRVRRQIRRLLVQRAVMGVQDRAVQVLQEVRAFRGQL